MNDILESLQENLGVVFLLFLLLTIILFLLDLPVISVLSAIASIATVATYINQRRRGETIKKESFDELVSENKKTLELRDEIEQMSGEIDDYTRMVRALDEKEIDLDDLIEEYRESERIILLTMINQKPSSDSDDHQGPNSFIREELEKELGLERITHFTWAVPPEEVPSELAHADRNELRSWLQEKVYDRHSNRSGDLPMFVVADLRQAVSINDTEGRQMNVEFIDDIIAQSEIFSNNDRLAEILASENINLSEIIKEGNIFFFLPTYMSSDEVSLLKDQRESFEKDIGEPNLRSLADVDKKSQIENALKKRDISKPDEVAEDIIDEAKIWHEKTREIW